MIAPLLFLRLFFVQVLSNIGHQALLIGGGKVFNRAGLNIVKGKPVEGFKKLNPSIGPLLLLLGMPLFEVGLKSCTCGFGQIFKDRQRF